MTIEALPKVLWLRAKDLGAVGSTVTVWTDAANGISYTPDGAGPTVIASTLPSGGKAVSGGGGNLFAGDAYTLWGGAVQDVAASSKFSTTDAYDPRNIAGTTGDWATTSPAPAWWKVTLKTAAVVTGYTVTSSNGQRNPKDWTFEGSNDDATWTVLDTRTGQLAANGSSAQTFANSTAFRYYRFSFTANNGGDLFYVNRIDFTGVALAYTQPAAAEAWFVVRSQAAPATSNGHFADFNGAGGNYYPFGSGSDVYDTFGRGRISFTPTVEVRNWRLYRMAVSATGQWRYLDGAQQYADASTSALGFYRMPHFNVSTNEVAEVIVRDRLSTSGEVADLITYFNTEHGLAVPGGSAPGDPSTVTGSLAAVAAKHTAAASGTAVVPTITGTVAVTGPQHTATLTNEIPTVTGLVAATGPKHTAAAVGDVPQPATRLEAWTADLSRRTSLALRAGGTIDAMPALELPPAGFVERPLMRTSLTVPALTSLADVVGGQAVSAADYAALEDAATVEEMGVPHVVIGGHDVTYFRGVPTQIGSFRSEEPFGDLSASVVFPQITSMDDEPDDSNVHPFNWSRIRANVQIILRRPDGTKTRLWSGHVVSHDLGNDSLSLSCQGSLWQASTDVHKVPTMLEPTDIGTLITKALNGVTSRRYPRLAAPRTGIVSRQRGSWSDSPLAYVQNLLATAWTASGRQWTVAKVPNTWRTYEMRLKKATPQWTVTNGARGVQVDLSRDGVAVRNVVYGHGVGKDGYAWWNYHYPNLRQDDAPAYPYSSAGAVMSVGSTDAGTASGEGVSVWQARARDLGYNVTVNGVFSSDDAAAARAVQRRYGLQVDGVVGPQTWAGTFGVGGNGGDLSGAIRLPLAADPRTQKWLYNADGSVAGENPEYDPNHLIYADDVDFGSGISREQGIESAQQIVDRESDPGWTGRITLRADPREGSRFLINEGDKITLVGFRGADRVLHITAADYSLDGLTVTLDVDEKSRDAMTLAQIRDRNKEARKDPARRPGNVNRRSRLDVDQVVPYDGESGAGWIPKHAIYGGLWTVIRIPVSELGRVAKLDIRTTGPASRFAIALFGAPIQPSHLVKYVGNPLASDSPFEANASTLEDRFGFIEGWGQKGQAAGYWPGQDGGALTGRLVDTGGFEYVSAKPPWVWVAEYAATSTFISGRILPAPIQ